MNRRSKPTKCQSWDIYNEMEVQADEEGLENDDAALAHIKECEKCAARYGREVVAMLIREGAYGVWPVDPAIHELGIVEEELHDLYVTTPEDRRVAILASGMKSVPLFEHTGRFPHWMSEKDREKLKALTFARVTERHEATEASALHVTADDREAAVEVLGMHDSVGTAYISKGIFPKHLGAVSCIRLSRVAQMRASLRAKLDVLQTRIEKLELLARTHMSEGVVKGMLKILAEGLHGEGDH